MSVRSVRQIGDPVLRTVARKIEAHEFNSPFLQNLVNDMVATMKACNGAGIAAPQIGEPLRVFVVHGSGNNPRYPYKPAIPLTVFVNPEIEILPPTYQGELMQLIEGCLSVPGVRGQVLRFPHVRVRAQNVDGSEFIVEAFGHAAGTMQHELDHLNGRMFPDHAAAGIFGPDALMTWDAYDEFYKPKFEPYANEIADKYPNAFTKSK